MRQTSTRCDVYERWTQVLEVDKGNKPQSPCTRAGPLSCKTWTKITTSASFAMSLIWHEEITRIVMAVVVIYITSNYSVSSQKDANTEKKDSSNSA